MTIVMMNARQTVFPFVSFEEKHKNAFYELVVLVKKNGKESMDVRRFMGDYIEHGRDFIKYFFVAN
jgi:hypothetical protein